jgi:hypothetical protein
MTGDDENFLSRWSRRKVQARRAETTPDAATAPGATPQDSQLAPTANGAAVDDGAAPANRPLQPVDELHGLDSDYREFLRPEVDDGLRRDALKKLFQDPHFNLMDGLDTYIDDYTKADPIPEAMLRTLNQAQGLIFDREDVERKDVDPHEVGEKDGEREGATRDEAETAAIGLPVSPASPAVSPQAAGAEPALPPEAGDGRGSDPVPAKPSS